MKKAIKRNKYQSDFSWKPNPKYVAIVAQIDINEPISISMGIYYHALSNKKRMDNHSLYL